MSARRTASWHVGEELAAAYAAGAAAEPEAWSLEKHVEACGACAVRVSAAVRAGAAGPVLAEVRAQVRSAVRATDRAVPVGGPRTPLVPRILWAAGPALRGSWLAALVLVACGAFALAYGAGFSGARPLLLALAPLLPPAGVAISYGRHADPMYEVAVSTPGGGLRLLLTRTAAVLAVSLPLLTLAGALLPRAPGAPGAAAWLLPGLALTLAAMALGSYVGCRAGAGTVGGAWALTVAVPALGGAGAEGQAPMAALSRQLTHVVSGAAAQSGWAVAALLCAALFTLRRRSFDLPSFTFHGTGRP